MLNEIEHGEPPYQTSNTGKICSAGLHVDLLVRKYLLDVCCECLSGY